LSEPLYFSADDCRLFGWLHRPDEQTSDLGIVICKPFGYEAICGHRSMRALADAAAAAGMPALRFDYRGTGDSADADAEADQIETWVRDVAAAIGTLRSCAGVRRVCVVGFRLGALLGALAAAGGAGVDALVLVAPVIEGRRYVRELRTTSLAAAANLSAGPPEKRPASDGAIEAGGFLLSAASVARLSQSSLTALAKAPAPKVLIIDREDLPTARTFGEMLDRLGARTRYLALPGFIKMMMTPPQFAAVPQQLLMAVSEWLQQIAAATDNSLAQAGMSHPDAAVVAAQLELPRAGSIPGTGLCERPIEIDPKPRLFGIVTEPVRDERRRRAVILVNSGADYHIGAGRMYVAMARRWADQGYVAVRMDLRGIGDSDTPRGGAPDEVFPPGAIGDIAAAVDFVRKHYGVREVTLAGLCSAGYHVLRAAVAGLQVNRILMVNPQNFSWREGMAVGDVQLADVVKDDRRRTFSSDTVKRLLTGKVDVGTVSRIYLQRARITLESVVRNTARGLHIRLPRDLGWELRDIAARGVKVVFVFAAGDPGIELLRIQGGSVVKRLGDRCRVYVIESADHTFTRIGPRARMEQVLSEELLAASH
jgi:alpha-beta hydrolase superfamily lysophospholipase